MKKTTAIALLGGSLGEAAKRLDISRQALAKWPDDLPRSMADRVIATKVRLEWHVALQAGLVSRRDVPEAVLDAIAV